MIGRIRGTLLEKNPPEILVDVHGVGYEINVPMSTFYNLPDVGQEITLLTHFIVREDAQLLYGFGTAKERAAFRQLIKISGIGARTALAVLSGMTVDALAQAVAKQESSLLTRVPGIGKKTAERLVLELKGKICADLDGVTLAAAPGQPRRRGCRPGCSGLFGSRSHSRGQEARPGRQCFRWHPRSPKIHGTLIFRTVENFSHAKRRTRRLHGSNKP
jgi:Holliday junction DNA helicase RuvA